MLKIPVLVFQPCTNLAGYICVEVTSPAQDEQFTYNKTICLTHIDIFFDMLVVLDSKELEFRNRISELQRYCNKSEKMARFDMTI